MMRMLRMLFKIKNNESGEVYNRPIDMPVGLQKKVRINLDSDFHLEEFVLLPNGNAVVVNFLRGEESYKTLPFDYDVIWYGNEGYRKDYRG